MLGLPDAVRDAALVVSGEACLDHQSLRGKASHGVAHIAAARRVPVVAIADRLGVTPAALTQAGIRQTYGLAELESDLPTDEQHRGADLPHRRASSPGSAPLNAKRPPAATTHTRRPAAGSADQRASTPRRRTRRPPQRHNRSICVWQWFSMK